MLEGKEENKITELSSTADAGTQHRREAQVFCSPGAREVGEELGGWKRGRGDGEGPLSQ